MMVMVMLLLVVVIRWVLGGLELKLWMVMLWRRVRAH